MNVDLLLPLEYLRPGEWAEVCELDGEPDWVGRLGELGLRVGCRVRMVRGGSPCLLEVGGGRLSLRGEQVARVLVRPLAD